MTKLGKSIQNSVVSFALILAGLGFLCGFGRANEPQIASQEAHIIRLKNGSLIRGRVVRFDGREFTVLMPGTKSRAIIHVDDVESIEFGEEEKLERPRRQEGPGPQPTARGAEPEAKAEPQLPSVRTEKPSQPEKAEKGAPAGEKPAEPRASLPRYVETAVKVPANEVWVDAGLDIQKGQKLRLAVTGRINISRTQSCGPEGIELKDPEKLLIDRPSGALIAVIGDDNDDFIFIGPRAEFQAARSGRLFLMVNDSRLEDNSGEFTVRIQVEELPPPAQKQG